MAQQNEKYATSLNTDTNVNFAVDKPIVNTTEGEKAKANLMLLSKATQLGATVYDDYKDYEVKTDVGENLLGEIDAYKDQSVSWNSLPFVQQDKVEPNEGDIKLNGVLSDVSNKSKVITNGVKQGKMTVFQSQMRIKELLQDAIKNNPGRVDVITKYSKQLLANSGISNIYAADTANENAIAAGRAQSQAKLETYIFDQAKKFGTEVYKLEDGSVDFPRTELGFQEQRTAFSMTEAEELANKSRDQDVAKEADSMVNQRLDTKLIIQSSQELRTYALELFDPTKNPDAENPLKFPGLINQLQTKIEQEQFKFLDSENGFGRFIDDPRIKPKFDMYNNSLNGLLTRTKTWRNGKDASEAFSYALTTAKAIDEAENMKYISPSNIANIQTLTSALDKLPAGDTKQKALFLRALTIGTQEISDGITAKMFDKKYPDLNSFYGNAIPGKKAFSDVLNTAIKINKVQTGTSQVQSDQNIEELITSAGLRWVNPNNSQLTNTAALTTLDDLSKVIFNPDNEALMTRIGKQGTTIDQELPASIDLLNARTATAVQSNLVKLIQSGAAEQFNFNETVVGEYSASIKNMDSIPELQKVDAIESVRKTNQVLSYINKQYKLQLWANGKEQTEKSWELFIDTYYPQLVKD